MRFQNLLLSKLTVCGFIFSFVFFPLQSKAVTSNYFSATTLIDSSLYAAGRVYNGADYDFAIAKFDTVSGELDTDFGTNGFVLTAIGDGDNTVKGIANDGTSLYVAGSADNGIDLDFAIAKFDATTGELVTSFGSNGVVIHDLDGRKNEINAIITDGTSLYVAGYTDNGINLDLIVAKYDATTGELDNSFSTDGIAVIPSLDESDQILWSLCSDGTSIYVAGQTGEYNENDFLVAKFNANSGSIDTSFDEDGYLITDIDAENESNNDMAYAIYTDGVSVYVAGSSEDTYILGISYVHIAVAKYDAATGATDLSFGTDGVIHTAVSEKNAYGFAMAADDTSLYVAGTADSIDDEDEFKLEFAIAKYDITTGDFDTSFSTDGQVITTLTTGYDVISSLATDGTNLFAAGYSQSDSDVDFALAKYDMTTGMPSTSFAATTELTDIVGNYEIEDTGDDDDTTGDDDFNSSGCQLQQSIAIPVSLTGYGYLFALGAVLLICRSFTNPV